MTAVGEPALIKAVAPEITRGSVLAGRYQVEAVIGRGGSGIVLRAFDRVAQVPVAVKILKPELASDPRWIDRFSRELRLARRIPHPNVCRVFDIGQADGHWFITMELAPGGTLRDQLGEHAKGRALEEKIADVRAVIAGLAAIHEAGIVHRDVKPDNFLRMSGADGRLVLSDFGLATNPAEASTVSILVGTPSYMAPEVVMGQQANFQSDVWSLGVVLHEVLFGARPEWTRGVEGSFVFRKTQRELTAKERALSGLIEECLHTDPSVRPENAIFVRLECERVLNGGKLRPPRRPARQVPWAWPALAAVVLVAAAIAGRQTWRHAEASTHEPRAASGITFSGAAQDWSKTASVVASTKGRVHCMEWLEPNRVLRVILGSPRRAIDVDARTLESSPDPLPEAAFALGCPRRSKRGQLLYETFDDRGRNQIMLANSERTLDDAKMITSGSAPVWLPSGDEFIYSVDDSHAALFSIPVMATNIIAEGPEDSGLLVDKAVSQDGQAIALRYFDINQKRHLVIHGLPSLSVIRRARFDNPVSDFVFAGTSDRLAFATSSPTGEVLGELDLRTVHASLLGGIPGLSVRMVTPAPSVWAMSATRLESDIWKQVGESRTERLTTDGESYGADLSARGDLLVQHSGPDHRSSLRLFRHGKPAEDVTEGPLDLTPSFLPDGSGWLYVDGRRHALRKCALSGGCEDLATPGDFPVFPFASPDGARIAYVTAVDREQVKTIDHSGNIRVLGPARPQCRPYWTTDNHLWVVQGTSQRPVWAKLDVETGERIGVADVHEPLNHDPRACITRGAPPGVALPAVAALISESSEVRLLSR